MTQRNTVIYLLILIVAAARLLPHPLNITPVGALGLFAGAFLPTRLAWLLPISALLLGDAANGFYTPIVMAYVYVGFALSSLIGRWLMFSQFTTTRLIQSILLSAFAFFLISNFGMWLAAYPLTLDGLLTCYVNAIPYFGRSLFGDALYSLLLFGTYGALIRFKAEQPRHVS